MARLRENRILDDVNDVRMENYSGAVDVIIDLRKVDDLALNVLATGTGAETFELQVSHDMTNWATMKDQGGNDVGGTLAAATEVVIFNLNGVNSPYARFLMPAATATGITIYLATREDD